MTSEQEASAIIMEAWEEFATASAAAERLNYELGVLNSVSADDALFVLTDVIRTIDEQIVRLYQKAGALDDRARLLAAGGDA